MKKKFIYLTIVLLGSLIGLVVVLWLIFNNLNLQKETLTEHAIVPPISYPTVSTPLSYTSQSNLETFIRNSESQYVNLKITELNNASLNGLDISLGTFFGNIYFVNSSTYTNDIEVYERVFLSQIQSGAFIKRGEFIYKNVKFNTSLMRLATGGYTYQVITGLKKGDKGYYLSVLIPRNMQDLSPAEIENTLRFELHPEHKVYLDLLLNISNLDLPNNMFTQPVIDTDLVNQFSNTSKQFGGGEFPTTF